MATVYGNQVSFNGGAAWWRILADYSGTTATIKFELTSGYTLWVRFTGTVNGTANSVLTYSSSATGAFTFGNVTISKTSSNTVAVTCTGGSWGQNGTSSLTIPKQEDPYSAPTVNSWSCSLVPTIIYLRSTITHSITKGTGNMWAENEIDVDKSDSQVVKQVYIYSGRTSNYSGTHDLTITGTELVSGGYAGKTLYSNLQIWDTDNKYDSDTRFSSGWTVPSNLESSPSTPGTPTLSKITASDFTINFKNCPSWVRGETSAYYQYDIFTAAGRFMQKYGQTHASASGGDISYVIGSYQASGSTCDDPQTETVSAGTYYAYTFTRGATYKFSSRVHTKFLGISRSSDKSGELEVYIPYLPTLSKTSFNYVWRNSTGRVDFRLQSATLVTSNPNNEYIGNRYLSMDSTKALISSVVGNIWNGSVESNYWRYNKQYNNQAISGTSYAWLCYATDKYSESVIDPIVVTDDWSQPAGLINCALGNISIDVFGNFKAGNCILNMPDNTLPVGTMTATLQMSKNSNFSTITHQQTKTVENFGTINNLFDDIEMEGSDIGTNYIRIKWNLSSSSNYYNTDDVYSPVKTIEFTGIIPEIDEFTGYVDYATGKIKCKIKESTGIPKPKLYLEVFRVSGGGVYQTFEVTENTEYTLPYDEPGTIWYVRAKATNALGTVYALDESGSIQEYTYQIPYTTTSDYDEVANPTISAGKILYNRQCTMNFTWTNIVTNVDHVEYNIRVASTNNPITPTDHTNKTSGYNYTFNNRIDDEEVRFTLEVVLYNSFNEVIVTYQIESNRINLDALDLGGQGFTYHTNTTYHSIEYILNTFDKNTTSEGDDNKLVQMSVTLVDEATGQEVEKYFIGDEVPTMHSLDLDPIENYLFEDLKANYTYTLIIDTLCVNPLDLSKQHRKTVTVDVTTNDIAVYPVKNIQTTITKLVDNKPTSNSNVQIKWDSPNPGDVEVTDYVVAYRKNSNPYTLVYTQNRNYTLASEIIPLQNDDEVYIRIGARYIDWFGNDVIKWIDLPVITAFSTNYIYYRCSYPKVEQKERFMYKIVDTGTAETLVRNVHINK